VVIETVEYSVNWKTFHKGCSFFIPCVNPVAALPTIKETIKRLKMEVVTKVVILEGVRGLRVWRV
jgi:hypothetical protein